MGFGVVNFNFLIGGFVYGILRYLYIDLLFGRVLILLIIVLDLVWMMGEFWIFLGLVWVDFEVKRIVNVIMKINY